MWNDSICSKQIGSPTLMGQEDLGTQGKGAQSHRGQDSLLPRLKISQCWMHTWDSLQANKTKWHLYAWWQIIQSGWRRHGTEHSDKVSASVGFLCSIPEVPKWPTDHGVTAVGVCSVRRSYLCHFFIVLHRLNFLSVHSWRVVKSNLQKY